MERAGWDAAYFCDIIYLNQSPLYSRRYFKNWRQFVSLVPAFEIRESCRTHFLCGIKIGKICLILLNYLLICGIFLWEGDFMRNKIWEYLIPSLKDKETLWNECIFIFDTNVLLNLYRYTSNTRDTLLAAFDDLKERIWLPYQVAYEYAKDRFDVIYETVEKYKKLDRLEEEFINQYVQELRVKPSDAAIKELQASIDTWITAQKTKNLVVTQASNDQILEKLLNIFEEKVGVPFSQEELDSIRLEGKDRYEKQIPPGFCDAKKENGGIENNAYGDLIVWKEILSIASKIHKDIIFVTHDQKADWWSKAKGRTVGPRVELRTEFFKITGQKFYMYSMEMFLEQYSSHKGQTADKSVIDEVADMRGATQKRHKRPSNFAEYAIVLERNIIRLHQQITRRQAVIDHLQSKYANSPMPLDVSTQLENTRAKLLQLQHELAVKEEELSLWHSRISKSSNSPQ